MGTPPGPVKVFWPNCPVRAVVSAPVGPGTPAAGPGPGTPPPPPRPRSFASPRIVVGVTEKEAATFVKNGENFDVSTPACPFQRSCTRLRLNPGSRSEAKVLLIVCVCQPVRLGCFACSKL